MRLADGSFTVILTQRAAERAGLVSMERPAPVRR
jgi:hypothetical protein